MTLPRVALAGNPNVGKTSLFNALTGARLKVGNYAGVTVETRSGHVATPGGAVTLLDLPGTYSLTPISEDEAVAYRCLAASDHDPPPDAVLLVVDAANLARNLYLVMQLIELGLPVCIALNMMDVAREAGLELDPEALADCLGVPVVPTVARTGEGIPELRTALASCRTWSKGDPSRRTRLLADHAPKLDDTDNTPGERAEIFTTALDTVVDTVRRRWLLAAYAADTLEFLICTSNEREALRAVDRTRAEQNTAAWIERRYTEVDAVLNSINYGKGQPSQAPAMGRSERIDRILTHRVWGLLIFVGVMALLFQSIYTWATPLMDVIEALMGGLADAIKTSIGPGLLTDLLTEGVIGGVGNVVVFVPQIALLFLFLGLLEDTGYLARAAFLIDRIMARVGLHGRAFVPLLSGYACAIPAIMGTRTISSFKDRLVTMLMIPYMSCSARLPVYLLIIAALFPAEQRIGPLTVGGLMLLLMYVLSTISALVIGAIFKRTILKSPTPPLVLELPPYRVPRLRNTLLHVYDRTGDFIKGAGTVILAMTVVLWALLSFPKPPPDAPADTPAISVSIGGKVGQAMEPVMAPMGQDGHMAIAILGSFAAREVFVSTLGLVHGIEGADDDDAPLRQVIAEAKKPDGSPRHTPLSGLAVMVFFVYACQCMSTLAVLKRETKTWRWPLFAFVSMTALAYFLAVAVFQVGRLLGY